jgi:hypothetical protein
LSGKSQSFPLLYHANKSLFARNTVDGRSSQSAYLAGRQVRAAHNTSRVPHSLICIPARSSHEIHIVTRFPNLQNIFSFNSCTLYFETASKFLIQSNIITDNISYFVKTATCFDLTAPSSALLLCKSYKKSLGLENY